MRYIPPAIISTVFIVLCTTSYANNPSYESLEQFCLATNADTAENCACGQAKADELLTPEEQQLVLGAMTQDPEAQSKIMQLDDGGQSLIEKVQEITKGCG